MRSTEIQTFDRASVILPNSDLVAGTVLNRTHTGTSGRVQIPIGVSYDADPRQVEAILLSIAEAHPAGAGGPRAGGALHGVQPQHHGLRDPLLAARRELLALGAFGHQFRDRQPLPRGGDRVPHAAAGAARAPARRGQRRVPRRGAERGRGQGRRRRRSEPGRRRRGSDASSARSAKGVREAIPHASKRLLDAQACTAMHNSCATQSARTRRYAVSRRPARGMLSSVPRCGRASREASGAGRTVRTRGARAQGRAIRRRRTPRRSGWRGGCGCRAGCRSARCGPCSSPRRGRRSPSPRPGRG